MCIDTAEHPNVWPANILEGVLLEIRRGRASLTRVGFRGDGQEPMNTIRQFATFYLHGFFFGVDVLKVQEVIRHLEMTRIPLAHVMVQGLINLRGQIIPAIDLRRRLEFPAREEHRLPMNMVVRTEDGGFSLLVDEIGDVIEVPESCYERLPPTVVGAARELIQGVYKLKGRLLLILDAERTVCLPDVLDPSTLKK